MNSAQLILKICLPEDWQLLQNFARQAFVAAFGAQNTPDNMQAYLEKSFSDQQVQNELGDPESAFWMAWYDGQLVGYLKVNFGAAQNERLDWPAMEIERIYVETSFQGLGVAQALLAKARELAKAAGVAIIWLGVWEHNPKAIRFYEKNGFEKFGEHRFFLGNDEQTDWLMKTNLEN